MKRSFLLLEVIIALSLFALFASTFFVSPARLLKQKITEVHTLELAYLADTCLLDALQEIPHIPFSSITNQKKAPLRYLPEMETPLGTCIRSYTVSTESEPVQEATTGAPIKKCAITATLQLGEASYTTKKYVLIYEKKTHSF